jgi:hypothetical protein
MARPLCMTAIRNLMLAAAFVTLFAGCDALFGAKTDVTTDEIFDEARTDPTLFQEVEYVPLFPFFSIGGDGSPLVGPTDVYVGYDQFIYVTDSRGLHVLDLAGRPANFVPIDGGATNVIQDRRFDVYVTAKRDTTLGNRTWRLPAIIKYAGLTTGNPRIAHILWHPFDDETRRFNRPDPVDTDELAEFTGVGILSNNSILVSRRGPVNDPTSVILPHNAVLEFNSAGEPLSQILLSPTIPSLRSAVSPVDLMTFVHPPQRQSYAPEKNFMIAQAPASGPLQFSVLSIRAVQTPDGLEYRPDTDMVQSAANPELGESFLYDEFRFARPGGLAYAADGTNYIFVTDTGKDSLFVFTSRGIEGVAPPPGARTTQPVRVSFGGAGSGASQFNDPLGIAYFRRIVYVADHGNNRISRFRLNTDFE